MKLATVVGKIWATRKAESMEKYKLLRVKLHDSGEILLAADTVDAGEGDEVIIVSGSSARIGSQHRSDPIDATIIGVVDPRK